MNRRDLLPLCALSVMAPRWLCAQPTARPYRIYMVTWRGATDVEKGFRDYLASRQVAVEYIMRDAAQKPQRLAEFVAEIRKLKPDLVYTWGTSATLGIVGAHDRRAGFIDDIPVIFTMVASPVGAKLVDSLASSKGNLTGVYHVAPTVSVLKAMRAYRAFSKLGVLYSPADHGSVAVVRELRELARQEGFEVLEKKFRLDASGKHTAEGIADSVRELKLAGAEWLFNTPDVAFFSRVADVAAAAVAERLPIFATTEAVMLSRAGILAGLVSKYYDIGQLTAYKAEQILVKKQAPQSIPIGTLSRFSFMVRMDVAKQIKLLPPLALFNYAEFI